MPAIRTLASKVLRAVLRHAPPNSEDWAAAMFCELDYIEGDWAALFWAIGSTTAILRHSIHGWRGWFGRKSDGKETLMTNGAGKRTAGILTGAGISAMLVVCAFGLLLLANYLLPGLGLDRLEWTHWLTVIVIPEIMFVVAVAMLWRRRHAMAVGILLTAIVLATHAVVHVATHFH